MEPVSLAKNYNTNGNEWPPGFVAPELPNLNLPTLDAPLIRAGNLQPHFKEPEDEMVLVAIDKKDIKAIEKFASKNENSIAYTWLGHSHLFGKNGVKLSQSKAKSYLKKAEQLNHPKGTYDLSCWYDMNGRIEESFRMLERSAKFGYEEAVTKLGELCWSGENPSRARYIFKQAILMGIENNYHTRLAEYHYFGIQCEVDYDQAYRHYYYAAVVKNEPHAYFGLGKCFLTGNGGPENYQLAMNWFNKGLSQGDEGGVSNNALGLMYLRGLGVPIDFNQAIKHFEEAKNLRFNKIQSEKNIECAKQCLQLLDSETIRDTILKHFSQEYDWDSKQVPLSLKGKSFSLPNPFAPREYSRSDEFAVRLLDGIAHALTRSLTI